MFITFILPEDNRSGGVRVTAIMAQLLQERGHTVRICLVKKKRASERFRKLSRRVRNLKDDGWVHLFSGKVEEEPDLDTAKFAAKEIVIAVGTYMIPHLVRISADVIKLRYNHGLPAEFDSGAETAWSHDIPSITVSGTLVPRLEELAPNTCLGVVPNGIDPNQYYDMNLERDGIGVFYGRHPNKAPDFIKSVLSRLHEMLPGTPLYLVSTEECPPELSFVRALRYPPVEKVREIYNRCRVWLLPSDTEGLPGPVLEAMSCGTLVVSTDNLGSLEIIEHNKTGLISPRRDLAGFVDNVQLALTDDQLWHRITVAGKVKASEFSWKAAADKMESMLGELKSSRHQQ